MNGITVRGNYRYSTRCLAQVSAIAGVLRLLQQRFGEAVIRLASMLGPPLPVPIRVNAKPDGTPLGRLGGLVTPRDECV